MRKNSLERPLVSVIIPVHNGCVYVKQAIESILSQSYQNFELIIIDDHSTDNTLEIIKQYGKLYSNKIKVIRVKKRLGAYGAANVAIRQAKGEFIAPMDSDDVSHPERLKEQIEFFLHNKETIVVGTQARIIDKEGIVIGKKIFPLTHEEIYKKFLEVFPIVHPSCMIRRSLLPKKNQLYKNKYGVNDDYYTFFTFFEYGKFYNLPECLFDYRIHSGNSSLQNIKQKFYNTVKIRLVALFKLHYRPTFISLMKFFGQIFMVTTLPESMLTRVYLLIKGVYTPQNVKIYLSKKLGLAFVKAKNFSFMFLRIH